MEEHKHRVKGGEGREADVNRGEERRGEERRGDEERRYMSISFDVLGVRRFEEMS